jgi:peroxiredoxin
MKDMKAKAILAVVGALAVGVSVACMQVPVEAQKADAKAPAFESKASDGKTYTLAQLTEKKPVFLYFVKRNCGSNPMSVKLYNRLFEAYKGKANFVAVINTNEEGYKSFVGEYKAPFIGILDPKKDVIHAYGIKASQTVVMVDKDGKRTKFGGFGKQSLTELNLAMAKSLGVEAAKVDLSDAPDGVAYG